MLSRIKKNKKKCLFQLFQNFLQIGLLARKGLYVELFQFCIMKSETMIEGLGYIEEALKVFFSFHILWMIKACLNFLIPVSDSINITVVIAYFLVCRLSSALSRTSKTPGSNKTGKHRSSTSCIWQPPGAAACSTKPERLRTMLKIYTICPIIC